MRKSKAGRRPQDVLPLFFDRGDSDHSMGLPKEKPAEEGMTFHPITSWPRKHYRILSDRRKPMRFLLLLGYTVVEFSNPRRPIDPSLRDRFEKERRGQEIASPKSVLLRCCNSHLGYGSDSFVLEVVSEDRDKDKDKGKSKG